MSDNSQPTETRQGNANAFFARLLASMIASTDAEVRISTGSGTPCSCDDPDCLLRAIFSKDEPIPSNDEVKTLITNRDTKGLTTWCKNNFDKVNLPLAGSNETPLICAINHEWAEGLEILLENNAFPDFCKENTPLPIFIAAFKNLLVPLVILIKHNAKLDYEITISDTVCNILEFMCMKHSTTSDRRLPTATFSHLISFIVNSQAYSHMLWKVNNKGHNLLHICALTNALPFMLELAHAMKQKDTRKFQEYINMPAEKGYTPLHFAVQHNDVALVSAYCSFGAMVDVRLNTPDATTPSEMTSKGKVKAMLNAYRTVRAYAEVPPLVDRSADLEDEPMISDAPDNK